MTDVVESIPGQDTAHPLDLLLSLVVPLIAKLPSNVVVAPLNTVRTVAAVHALSAEDALDFVTEERIVRLFRGFMAASCIGTIFPFLMSLQLVLAKYGVTGVSTIPLDKLSLLSTILAQPLEVIATKQRTFDAPHNPFTVARQLIAEGGVRRLFSGLLPRLAYASIHTSLYAVLFKQSALFLIYGVGFHNPRLGRLFCAFSAWLGSSLVSYPLHRAARIQAATGWSLVGSLRAMFNRIRPALAVTPGATTKKASPTAAREASPEEEGERGALRASSLSPASWDALRKNVAVANISSAYDGFAVAALVGLSELGYRSLVM